MRDITYKLENNVFLASMQVDDDDDGVLILMRYMMQRCKRSQTIVLLVAVSLASVILYSGRLSQIQRRTKQVSSSLSLASQRTLDDAESNSASSDSAFISERGIQLDNSSHNTKINRPRLYQCGWGTYEHFATSVFSEYDPDIIDLLQMKEEILSNISSLPDDITIYGRYGPCPDSVKAWLQTNYSGKILSLNGERPRVSQKWKELDITSENTFILGPDDTAKQCMPFLYAAMVIMSTDLAEHQPFLFNHELKPRNDKTHFLVYAAKKPVAYRNRAFQSLSRLGTVHHVGRSKGVLPSDNITFREGFANQHWTRNAKLFSEYRFCLCMENINSEGYVTEKIVMAFLGGCIPVYYGSQNVFDVFNKNAFIYYNVENPEPALQQVVYLESNQTAYEEMLTSQPILANGEETIREYFSYRDDLGGGVLKQRIRSFVGISTSGLEQKEYGLLF